MKSGPWYIKNPGLGLEVGDVLDLGSAGAHGIPYKRGSLGDNSGTNFTDLGTNGRIDYSGLQFVIIEAGKLTCERITKSDPRRSDALGGGACWVAEDHP
jgi:hypothetical protein